MDNRIIDCENGEVAIGYKEYLKTNHWLGIRQQAIKKAGGVCQKCGKQRKLQVHHLHYNSIGYEDLADLLPVCSECHKKIHGIVKNTPKPKNYSKPKNKRKSRKKKRKNYKAVNRERLKREKNGKYTDANDKIDAIMRKNGATPKHRYG